MSHSDEEVELVNNPDSWSNARRVLKAMGPIPSSVGNAVKCLWKDHLLSREQGKLEISFGSKSAVRLVDKSSVLKMPLYFAAQDLFPERFAEIKEDEAGTALIKILHPGLFVSCLTLVYLHRRFNKICPADEWQELSKEYVLNTELGYLIGKSTESIGPAVGALIGGLRFAALALMLKHDPSSFIAYQNRGKSFDVIFEHKKWGCDHGQIMALILKALSIGAEQFEIAGAIRGFHPEPLGDDYFSWAAVTDLMDGIKAEKDVNEIDLSRSGLSLSSDELSQITEETNNLFKEGTTFAWMLRGSKE